MNIALVSWATIAIPLVSSVLLANIGPYVKQRTISLISLSSLSIVCILTGILGFEVFIQGNQYHIQGFTWLSTGKTLLFQTGLWIDPLSVTLMAVITSVALVVYFYSLSYMHQEVHYHYYFSYLALFIFAMQLLVTANNLLQLFLGWELVGLASYLLIGFWFQKQEAIRAALKAFLINRAGDIGLLLGISLLIIYTGSADYLNIFEKLPTLTPVTISLWGYSISLLNIIGVLLFLGAMSKSAQIPMHLWLPDSMVGPTPVSALMHAATMVTAGIYMVSRLSPIFEQAPGARLFILFIGATTALLLGLVALVQKNIKRVIAFSTISQLGYMAAGLGVSAYTASIFHLVTHAYFKALLFLSAGSISLALHHEQSLHKMGNLWTKLPITYFCFMMGAFSLIGLPPFSGFYSKDYLLSAVYHAAQQGSIIANYAFYSLTIGIFITALYTGRLIFLIFHQKPAILSKSPTKVQESDYFILSALLILAIPSVILGRLLMHTEMLPWLTTLLHTLNPSHPLTPHYSFIPFLSTALSIMGLLVIGIGYPLWPFIFAKAPVLGNKLYKILANQYGLEKLHQRAIITIIQRIAKQFATIDTFFIDRLVVQGSTKLVRFIANRLQIVHSGWLYHYLLIMIMSLILFLIGVIIRA